MPRLIKIIFVEDVEEDALLLVRELKKGDFDPQWQRVEKADDFINALDTKKWDLAVIDYSLPEFSGLEALEILKKKEPDLPAIMVSGKMGEDSAVEAMVAGAADYIIKGKYSRLTPAVNRELKEAEIRSEKKRIEKKLRESERKYRLLAENVSDVIWTMDLNLRITYVSPSITALTGFEVEELTGMSLDQIVSPEHMPTLMEIFQTELQAVKTQLHQPRTFEVEHLCKDGSRVPIEVRATFVIDENGEPIGLLGVTRDISKRKQAQEELKKAYDQLEQRVEERTNELKQAKLAAEEANKARGKFLANMSHEIRTPMNGVIGITSLLLETDLTVEQRDYAETIKDCGDVLLTLVNDILDFSKIEAGKLELEIIEFDLRHTLETISDVLAVRAFEKGIELIPLISPGVPARVKGDPGRLRQVLTNLLGNAVKFTEEGEVALHVTVEHEEKNRVTIKFAVVDTGIGIVPEKQDKIFKAFTQADGPANLKYKGTGLGLTISKQLTEIMGGRLEVESEPGKGSTFWFTAGFEKVASEEPVPLRKAAAQDVCGKRVLVLGDNETGRRAIANTLISWGCRADTVEQPESALAVLRKAKAAGDPFAIVILDKTIGQNNSVFLGRQIKNDAALQDIYLVMLASVGERGEVAQYREAGFSAYLTKPVKQQQLRDTLLLVLGGSNKDKTGKKELVTRYTVEETQNTDVRILVAEDDLLCRKVAVKMLETIGYRADVVHNGLEAVKALEATSYDLVFMDCQMPEMDGYTATGKIREEQSAVLDRKVPIIAMTAGAIKGDREKCLAAGMDDYISKPINMVELSGLIKRWLPDREKYPA